MKKKKSSKIKNYIILICIVVTLVLFYKFVIQGQGNLFNIETSTSSNAFGSTQKSDRKETDSQGHTEDFWTNNKFKW